MSVTKLPSGRYRVQIRKKYMKFDALYETEAEARAAEQDALARAQPPDKGITLRALWSRYKDSQLFDEKTANTQRTESQRIKPVMDKLGDYTLSELEANPGLIYDYIDERKRTISKKTKKRMSGTSVRLEVAALSSVVAFAKQRKLVHANFVSSISRPAQTKRSRRVDNEEQGRLAIHARSSKENIARASRFMLLVRHLGCRPGELNELTVSNIRLDKHEVLFPDTKNGTDRAVHLTKDARELIHLQLDTVPEDCPYLFWSVSNDKEYTPYRYSYGAKLLIENDIVGPGFHPHAGRREFVSRAIEAGVPLTTIKKQTGHKSVQAIEIYDNGLSTAPEIRAALDKLADTVSFENLMGAMSAAGMTEEQREAFLSKLGQGQFKSFEDASKDKRARKA